MGGWALKIRPDPGRSDGRASSAERPSMPARQREHRRFRPRQALEACQTAAPVRTRLIASEAESHNVQIIVIIRTLF